MNFSGALFLNRQSRDSGTRVSDVRLLRKQYNLWFPRECLLRQRPVGIEVPD